MNRERILLLSVLAIVGLYFLALRAPASPVRQRDPGRRTATVREVESVALRMATLRQDSAVFRVYTTVRPHPRDTLAVKSGLAPRDLPTLWPPTSMTVDHKHTGLLRRKAATPGEGGGVPELPAPPAAAERAAAADQGPRVDTWSHDVGGVVQRGQILSIVRPGGVVRPTGGKLGYGQQMGEFEKFLCLLEVDPERVSVQRLATELEVRFAVGATNRFAFPAEIREIRVAVSGKDKTYFDGAKEWLRLPPESFAARRDRGRELMDLGRKLGDRHLLEWSLVVLEEARALAPGQAQADLGEVLRTMLEAAIRLNKQEEVLALAFDFLARFPGDEPVIEYVGRLVNSPSFALPRQAEAWFRRAAQSAEAQRARARILVELGEHDEARRILESRAAGTGAEVDLLRARLHLAASDFAGAEALARPHASGDLAATALQILGGAAYASGRAAEAEAHFLEAARRDPARSTAFSDLGLALLVQGKSEGAAACFDRALQLDSVYNAVVPALGKACLDLNAGRLEEARAKLEDLASNNPRDLWVRAYLAEARERLGDLEGAAQLYRSVLDENYRFRFVIARLGVVLARLAEAASGEQAAALAAEAIADLRKANELDPGDATVAYILARFLTLREEHLRVADQLFDKVRAAPAPPWDPDLPVWAEAGRAALMYLDPERPERDALGAFQVVLDTIRRRPEYRDTAPGAAKPETHPAFAYADACIRVIKETQLKVIETWTFAQRPRDWNADFKSPMNISFERDRERARFSGEIDLQGKARSIELALTLCSLGYTHRALTGQNFYKVVFEGELPPPGQGDADFAMGLVDRTPGARTGPAGVQVRYDKRDRVVAARLDGGQSDRFKRREDYAIFQDRPWPPGRFTLTIEVVDRAKGEIAVSLATGDGPPVELFRDTMSLLGRGRSNRPFSIAAWVEGNDGERFQDIYLNRVELTRQEAK